MFSSQDRYDSFQLKTTVQFEAFVSELQQNLRKNISVEDIRCTVKTNVVIPKEKVTQEKRGRVRNRGIGRGIYSGYYGWDDSFLYAYMWSDMMHANHIHVHDTYLVNDEGAEMGEVPEEGIDAHESNVFDSEQDYDSRVSEADSIAVSEDTTVNS